MLMIFIPAIILAGFILFLQVLRYEPLFPEKSAEEESFSIPILADDPVVGLKRAGKVVVAFEDYSCASCNEYDAILTQLISKHPVALKVVWKGLPVTRYPYPSEPAIMYGYCAQAQNKFPEFKALAFSLSDQLSESVLQKIGSDIGLDMEKLTACAESDAAKAHLEQNKSIAAILNIQSVPTFFIDNKQVTVAPTLEAWEQALGLSGTTN